MILYTKPRVTLLARQEYLGAPHINWESDSAVPAEQLAEFGGRLCYLSFGTDAGIEGHKTIKGRSTNKAYLNNILSVGHGSVIEHSVWTFLFEGISRALTHELVRHRHFSYSQLSQRYVDESEVGFVLPPEIMDDPQAIQLFEASCRGALRDYQMLLKAMTRKLEGEQNSTMLKKRARQAARAVLPNSTETKIVVTGNARAFRHFIEMRASPSADREIRALAIEVLKVLQEEAPNIFGDFEIKTNDEDGSLIAVTPYSGV